MKDPATLGLWVRSYELVGYGDPSARLNFRFRIFDLCADNKHLLYSEQVSRHPEHRRLGEAGLIESVEFVVDSQNIGEFAKFCEDVLIEALKAGIAITGITRVDVQVIHRGRGVLFK